MKKKNANMKNPKKNPNFSKIIDKISGKKEKKTIKATKTVKPKVKKSKVWDSGLNIVTEPVIFIPRYLYLVCEKIQAEVGMNTEFSILAKGDYSPEGFTVTDEYIIPKQKVTSGDVDYENLSQYRQEGFNVVIHSHHSMSTPFFSGTDKNFINANNPCSILYTNAGGFVLATLKFNQGNNIFIMQTNKVKTFEENEVTVDGLENIEKSTFVKKPLNKTKQGSLYKGKPFFDDPLDNDPFYDEPKLLEGQNGKLEEAVTIEIHKDNRETEIVDGVILDNYKDDYCKMCELKDTDKCQSCTIWG